MKCGCCQIRKEPTLDGASVPLGSVISSSALRGTPDDGLFHGQQVPRFHVPAQCAVQQSDAPKVAAKPDATKSFRDGIYQTRSYRQTCFLRRNTTADWMASRYWLNTRTFQFFGTRIGTMREVDSSTILPEIRPIAVALAAEFRRK